MKLKTLRCAGSMGWVFMIALVWIASGAHREAIGAEAILNGSFETATISPAQSLIQVPSADTIANWSASVVEYGGRGAAASGARYVHLNTAAGGAGSINQAVTTKSGVEYAVSFKYSGHPDASSNGVKPALRVVVIGVATSDPFEFDRVVTFENLQWQSGQFRFRASSTRTIVMFASFNTGKTTGAFVDEVSLVEAASLPVPPSILIQPLGRIVAPGTQVTFTVNADGTQLNYQWSKDGVNLPGANQSSFSIASASVSDGGIYSVAISNTGGTVTSSTAVLSVVAGLPEFTLKLPTNMVVVQGATLRLEAAASNVATNGYIWLRSGFSGLIPITGPSSPVYVQFNMTANLGGLWAIVASNAVGRITNTTSVKVIGLPKIATQADADIRVQVGQRLNIGPKSFSGDNTPYAFQWHKDGEVLVNSTNQNLVKTAALADAGSYYVTISNPAGLTVSSNSLVQVFSGPVPAWIQSPLPEGVTVEEGTSFNLRVAAAGEQPLHYTWWQNGAIIAAGLNGSTYFSNNIPITASGDYYVVVTNSTGSATSTVERVTVYPKQTAPVLSPFNYTTNAVGGQSITLAFTLQQGTLLSFQWHRRVFANNQNVDTAIPGATNLTYTLANPLRTDGGQYVLTATNFKGTYSAIVTLNVATTPEFTNQPVSQEVVAGTQVNLNANAEPFQPLISYQWLKEGVEIPGATFQSYSFTASAATVGSYTLRARNDAGTTLSRAASVAVVSPQPTSRLLTLVADRSVAIPQRAGQFFRVVGDGKLRSKVVTFQGTTNFPDVGGLYRWEAGAIQRVFDLSMVPPGFSGTPTFLDALSHEDQGNINFLASRTNENKSSLFVWSNGVPNLVLGKGAPMPGSPGKEFDRIGYPTRAGSATGFLGFDPISTTNGPGGFRGLYVWDGLAVSKWADSAGGLPGGDGRWLGNSAQVGFDGSTLAAWLVDGTTNSGIFASVNAGSLQKIAFSGDPIPGGGFFGGFSSPPQVQQGRILFLGHAGSFGVGYLLEYSTAGLRVIAMTGAPVSGSSVGLGSPAHWFGYASDGSILFTANGPGSKSGIYRWREGIITAELTSLNTFNGRPIRYAYLEDVDGEDLLVNLSFDGSNFGLYVSFGNGGEMQARPQITIVRTAAGLRLNWPAGGRLEFSDNLLNWAESTANSGDELPFNAAQARFFRVRVPTP